MKKIIIYVKVTAFIFLLNNATNTHGDETVLLDEITVNARLWDEKIQQVPVSTSIIRPEKGSANLEINTLQNTTAGISLEESSVQTRVIIRGTSGVDGGLQDPVGYFINGVALPLGGNQLPSLFDIKSIELVKGPQGALYGRNTEAGAIKINSTDPSWSLSGNASLTSGIVDGANGNSPLNIVSGQISNTLIDKKLAGSLAFRIEDNQGPFINNADNDDTGGEIDNGTLSSGLTYLASDNTDIRFKSVIDKSDKGRNRFRFNDGINRTERFTTNTDTNGFDNENIGVHSLEVNHSFNHIELTSITGITDYERQFAIDLDATTATLPATKLTLDNRSVSQEIRLASDDPSSRIKWLGGIYTYKEDSDIAFSISPFFKTTSRSTTIDQTGKAIFGQAEFALNKQWRISAGGRYEKIEQTGSQTLITSLSTNTYSANIDSTEFLPQAAISYQVNQDNLFYLSYAKGYLPGGYNYNSAGNVNSFTFKPEYSALTELGWKHGNNNTFNSQLTLYRNIITDKQIVDLLPGFVQSISNAGKTQAYGAELSLRLPINAHLSSFANIGIQRTEATTYTTTTLGKTQDFSGNDLPLSPEHTYSIGFEYSKPKGWFSRLAIRGSGEYYFNSQNTLKQSGFTIADTEIGYRFNSLTLSMWAKNITDEEVLSRAVSTQLGTVVEDMLPRTIGLTLKAEL